MFGLGFSEIITIVIVLLLLINPKDLPRILKRGGRFYGKIIREYNGFKKTLKNLEEEVSHLREFDDEGDSEK